MFSVSVHPTDSTRLELIIPGEQHFYVRAVNAAERQRWLVALGSSKAGTLESHKRRGLKTSNIYQTGVERFQTGLKLKVLKMFLLFSVQHLK